LDRLDLDELEAFCQGKIAHYKVPRYLEIVDEFPMTVTGKIRKVEMREVSTSAWDSVTTSRAGRSSAVDGRPVTPWRPRPFGTVPAREDGVHLDPDRDLARRNEHGGVKRHRTSPFEAAVAAAVEDQRAAFALDGQGLDATDADLVVTGVVDRLDAAVDPGQHSSETRRAARRGRPAKAIEPVARLG
jgi:hypothetical protein